MKAAPRKRMVSLLLLLSLLWCGGVNTVAAQQRSLPDDYLDVLLRIDEMQNEIQQLRNLVEKQDFEIRKLRRRQVELYGDLDTRLRAREGAGAPASALTVPPSLPDERPADRTPVLSNDDIDATAPPTVIGAPATTPSATDADTGTYTNADIDADASMSGLVEIFTPGADVESDPDSPLALLALPTNLLDEALQAVTEEVRGVYDEAFALMARSRYIDAIAAFTMFLRQFPNTDLSDDALYHIATSYYVTQDFEKALLGFESVMLYEDSRRIPDARFKIGDIQEKIGAHEEALTTFSGIIEDFPGTRVAILSRNRLERLERIEQQ